MTRSQLLFSLFAWSFYRWLHWLSSLHLPSVAYGEGSASCCSLPQCLPSSRDRFPRLSHLILVPQLWAATGSFANGKFSREDVLRYSAILHVACMANPTHSAYLSNVYLVGRLVCSRTSVLATLSLQLMLRMRRRLRRWKLFSFCSCLL